MITIGIPCYKQAEYLEGAIKSALNQTIPCEVIVINDGSPDNTEEVAKKFPVKLINQVNKGLASARNAAIMNMTGDYFLPLDADDLLETNCAERILQIAKETNADVIAPSIRTFGTSDQTTILMPDPKLEDFKAGNRLSYCSAIKKETLLEVGGYSPRYDALGGYEDMALWIALLARGKKIVTIPEVLMFYRTKPNSMWHDARKNHDAIMAQIKKDTPQFA